MFRLFSRFRGERCRKPKPVPPRRLPVRLSLEILEDRITPANLTWVFTGAAGTTDYATPGNWIQPPGATTSLPDDQDQAVIAAPCVISGSTDASVAEVDITGGGGLTVASGGTLNVAPNGNTAGFNGAISSAVGGTLDDSGTINVSGNEGLLAGPSTISGAFTLQSGGTSGADETSTGATTIASGGHVDSYGHSVFNIANTKSAPFTIAPGGTVDWNSIGAINVSGALSIGGTVDDLGQLDITPSTYLAGVGVTTPGADIYGPGTLETSGPANFSGGTVGPAGGFEVEATSTFQTSGSSTKTINSVFENWSTNTEFGGTGTINVGTLGTSGTLNNVAGSVLMLSTSVATNSKSSFVNGGELYASGGGTVSVTGLTSNTGESQIDVNSGTTLSLAGSDTLGGSLYLNSGATVLVPAGAVDTINSPFTEDHSGVSSGSFLVNGSLTITKSGSATFNGPLTVSGSKASLTANGPLTVYDLNVGSGGLLTANAGLTSAGPTTIGSGGNITTTTDAFVNNGDLTEAAGGTLSVGAGLTNNDLVLVGGTAGVAGTLQNNGSVEVQADGVLTASGELDNASSNSTLNVDAASGMFPAGILSVTSTGSLVNDGGTVTVAGTAGTAGTVTNSGTVEVTTGGELRGSSNVDNSGVLQLDGGSTFGETGTLDNTGTTVLGAGNTATVGALVQNGDLKVNIASAMDYGALGVTGLLTLTAAPDTLTLTLLNDYQPPSGTAFKILTFGSLQGEFADVEPPGWSVSYDTGYITANAP